MSSEKGGVCRVYLNQRPDASLWAALPLEACFHDLGLHVTSPEFLPGREP